MKSEANKNETTMPVGSGVLLGITNNSKNMKKKCSIPKCRRNATLQLLGNHPLCRKCGDDKNRKSRERSAKRRAEGKYSPAIVARWSESKRKRMMPNEKS
jgi:hypothetical protein